MSSFEGFWDKVSGKFNDQATREKYESMAVMVGSLALAESIPGLGELQMAGQVIDFIDPYGYNQAITRDALDGILTNQYSSIQDMQTSILNCYQGNDPNSSDCAKAKISPDSLANFAKLSPTLQEKRLKSLTSWVTPMAPEVLYEDMYICQLDTTLGDITTNCNDPVYKDLYTTFYNNNVASYQADAKAAAAKDAAAIAAQLIGTKDTTPSSVVDNQNAKNGKLIATMAIGYIVIVIVFFLIAKNIV